MKYVWVEIHWIAKCTTTGYSFTLFSSLIKDEERREGEWISKTCSKQVFFRDQLDVCVQYYKNKIKQCKFVEKYLRYLKKYIICEWLSFRGDYRGFYMKTKTAKPSTFNSLNFHSKSLKLLYLKYKLIYKISRLQWEIWSISFIFNWS